MALFHFFRVFEVEESHTRNRPTGYSLIQWSNVFKWTVVSKFKAQGRVQYQAVSAQKLHRCFVVLIVFGFLLCAFVFMKWFPFGPLGPAHTSSSVISNSLICMEDKSQKHKRHDNHMIITIPQACTPCPSMSRALALVHLVHLGKFNFEWFPPPQLFHFFPLLSATNHGALQQIQPFATKHLRPECCQPMCSQNSFCRNWPRWYGTAASHTMEHKLSASISTGNSHNQTLLWGCNELLCEWQLAPILPVAQMQF